MIPELNDFLSMFKSIRNDKGEISWRECCDLYERLEDRMPPLTTVPFDVHQNYSQYLKKAMAKAVDKRKTHDSRSKRLSKIKYPPSNFEAVL